MINLLLTSIMIAALCGMVFCNRKHKKGTYYQIAALILLVLVLISGGMFMCRLDSMGFFGLDKVDELRAANDQKYVESQAHVVASYIKNSRPGKKKVLLIVDKANNNLGGFVTSKLNDMNVKNVDYNLSKCCNPEPGDPIFAFISVTKGIRIHRCDCPNADNIRERYAYRILPARWAKKS
jgi:(p)ppGpp synthase/HD superfamily hydrolase